MAATYEGMIVVLGAGEPSGISGVINNSRPSGSEHTPCFGALVYAIATTGEAEFISSRSGRPVHVPIGDFFAHRSTATKNARLNSTPGVGRLPRVLPSIRTEHSGQSGRCFVVDAKPYI